MSALVVDDVAVRYGDVVALDSASLVVEPGRVCGLVGVNGAGKSTLYKAIMGLVRPERGSIAIGGRPADVARRAAAIAYVPQHDEVDRDFPVTVADVVGMGRYASLGPTRRLRREDRARVAEALERVELADLAGRTMRELSGGQRKRAFLARAIAQDASLLLLDEPFAGVDVASERTIVRLVRALCAEGRTALVATHDLHGLPSLADEAILLRRRVLLHAPVEEALRPEHVAVALGLDVGGAR